MSEVNVMQSDSKENFVPVEAIETSNNGTQMTVYSALSKRALYLKKLENYFSGKAAEVVKPVLGMNAEDVDALSKKLMSNYDSVRSTMKNFYALNAAIGQSNATTKVEIGGTTYTVSEAIARQKLVDYEITYLKSIKSQIVKGLDAVENNNTRDLAPEKINDWIDIRIKNLYPNGVDSSSDQYKEFVEDAKSKYVEFHTMKLVDPYKLADKIDTLIDEAETFKAEYNEKLNVSNITAMITVNLVN